MLKLYEKNDQLQRLFGLQLFRRRDQAGAKETGGYVPAYDALLPSSDGVLPRIGNVPVQYLLPDSAFKQEAEKFGQLLLYCCQTQYLPFFEEQERLEQKEY